MLALRARGRKRLILTGEGRVYGLVPARKR